MARSSRKSVAGTAEPEKAPAKKAAAKKAATVPKGSVTRREDLVVKQGEGTWTATELDEVLGELHDHRDRLDAEVHEYEEDLADLMRDSGNGAGQDQADIGYTSFERDHELTVVNNARDMLAQVQRALARIEDGTYGVCESCGDPVGKMRLMAFPRATLCMSCKQREERR